MDDSEMKKILDAIRGAKHEPEPEPEPAKATVEMQVIDIMERENTLLVKFRMSTKIKEAFMKILFKSKNRQMPIPITLEAE